jgi:hypothetical protein
MAQQNILSPGVQINEVDLSLRVSSPVGVGVLAMGFANSGPTDEVIQLTSIEEYESLYGKPTTAAERYSHHTIQALFDSPANIYFSRLPYGSNAGSIFSQDRYSALVYPVLPDDGTTDYSTVTTSGIGSAGLSSVTDFYLTKPYHVELSRAEYESIINGETQWTDLFGKDLDYTDISNIGNAGLIVLNTGKTTINEQFEGYYLGISDNLNTDPSEDYVDILKVQSINDVGDASQDYVEVPSVRLDFELSSSSDSSIDSLSEVMESIPSFSIVGDQFKDMVSLGLFKLRKTPFNNSEISLSYALTESYLGSFDPRRELQNPTGGPNQSTFLETVDNTSNNIELYVNPYLQDVFTLEITSDIPKKGLRVLTPDVVTTSPAFSSNNTGIENEYANELYPVGVYQNSRGDDKSIGSVPSKVERVLDLVENPEVFDLDIVVEGGLGTIFCSTTGTGESTYNETVIWDSLSGLGGAVDAPLADDETQANYSAIFTEFNTFCEKKRKDCIFIADPIRQIFVTGENSRVLSQTVDDGNGNLVPKNFSTYITKYLKNQFRGANSSYSVVYGNWVKVFDSASNRQVWVPYSGFAASLMANMDYVWEAPAGLTRGINSNINDIAIYPKQKERDQLYKDSINPVAFFPNEGFVTWGQKTMLKKPSAFDRINVRRVFLFLEKATLRTSRYFVFEPNTLFTRTQVINVLDPLFENVKNKDGIRDYIIVCNEKNNTDEVIEQNQLKIDIYIKPTKIAEFILVDFIATRQDANFEELIG